MTPPAAPRHRTPRQPSPRGGARRAKPARPRYGRIAAFGIAFVVTLVSVGAGVGLIPSDSRRAYAAPDRPDSVALAGAKVDASGTLEAPRVSTALPPDSGTGRRIVFDESAQRVWLVNASGRVRRTYLVSGSVTDNLQPGTYDVYSRSRWAVGIDDSGVMEYFVRFTRGNHAAIGFHSIPTKNGEPLQTRGQLGTPRSHGCIRQSLPDAIALWEFAPVGTAVVVTA